MSKKILIVIPNWNGLSVLIDCLKSLRKIEYEKYDVLIVDNGSSDGSQEEVRNNFSDVLLLESSTNMGFAHACNLGVDYAFEKAYDYILLLNNDTEVDETFLSKMVETAEKNKDIGIVGSKIVYYDQPKKIWFAGGDFVKWRVSGKHRNQWEQDNDSLNGEVPCDYVTGCNMLIKMDVFKTAGKFFEPYFLTVEDLDFCLKAQKKGWKVIVNLNSSIKHKVSFSRGGEDSFSDGYYGIRNRLYLAFKSEKYILGGIILLFIIIPVKMIQLSLKSKKEMLRGVFYGVRDFMKCKMGKYE